MLLSNGTRCVFHFNLHFSPGTFFKHLNPRKSTSLCHHKSINTTPLSHFGTLNSRQKDQIHLYVDALLQWNKRMNLTAVKEVDGVMERHVEDSLAILPPLKDSHRTPYGTSCDKLKLVDVGTGFGHGLPRMGGNADRVFEQALCLLGARRQRYCSSNIQIVRGRAEDRIWGRILVSESNLT